MSQPGLIRTITARRSPSGNGPSRQTLRLRTGASSFTPVRMALVLKAPTLPPSGPFVAPTRAMQPAPITLRLPCRRYSRDASLNKLIKRSARKGPSAPKLRGLCFLQRWLSAEINITSQPIALPPGASVRLSAASHVLAGMLITWRGEGPLAITDCPAGRCPRPRSRVTSRPHHRRRF